MTGTSRALIYGFEVGDMVWGKVKSHPRWPGHIFNEAFASSSVRRTRREGHVLVAFFGDSSYGWFDPAELIQFDVNFAEKSQQTNSRTFIKAVEEATDEASRRSALGLACKCRNKYNFRPANVPGYYVVDVSDYEPGGVYSASQIMKARDGFKPGETLAFVKQLAVGPHGCDQESFEFIKNKARAFAFRNAVFEEFDETYAQAFAVQSSRPSNDTAKVPNQLAKEPTRGIVILVNVLCLFAMFGLLRS
jgi:DNA (cytosine-5)-methyltransferase 3A